MSELDRIVTVNISRETASVSQAGFGTMLLLGPESEKPAGLSGRVGVYDASSYKTEYAAGTLIRAALDAHFSGDKKPVAVKVGFIEGAEGVSDALDAIEEADGSWYALALTSRASADQVAAAAWVQTAEKIAGFASDDADILDAASQTDIAFLLSDAGYSRAFAMYSSKANAVDNGFVECAWFGNILPELPGSVTWIYKTLPGQSTDQISGTQRVALKGKNANVYNVAGGVSITEYGTMADGSFIDEIRSVDWLKARIQEAIYSRLVNLKKIPYTDSGVTVVTTEVKQVLKRGEDQGILAPGEYAVTAPAVADVSVNDRANRLLPDVNFTGRLAGAIHDVIVNGTVTV